MSNNILEDFSKNLEYMSEKFEFILEMNENWEFNGVFEDDFDIQNDTIPLFFPEDDTEVNLTLTEFNKYVEDYKTHCFFANCLKAGNTYYLSVNPNISENNYELFYNLWILETSPWIYIKHESESIIPWFKMVEERVYDEDVWIYALMNNHYLCLINNTWKDLWENTIKENFLKFKFLVASKLWITFYEDENQYEDYDISYTLEWKDYNEYPIECMQDYVISKNVNTPWIKNLLLFKILEFISITSQHVDLISSIYGELEKFESKELKWTDIKWIIEIIKQKKVSTDYIWSLLKVIDISDIEKLLPEIIYNDIHIDWKIDIKRLSSWLTNTRNKYAHSTPNYNSKERECWDDGIKNFNNFIDKLVLKSIYWYISLEDYLKIK